MAEPGVQALRRATFSIRLYLRLVFVHHRALLEYRADFWIGILGAALTNGAPLLFVWAVFLNVPDIAGWRAWEVALLYGLAVAPRGLVELIADGQWALRILVNRGDFDRLLVRPVSPVLQVLTWFSSIHGIGSLSLGLVVITRAQVELQLDWSTSQWLMLCATILGSSVLIAAINLATNCIAFWEPAANSAFPFLVVNTLEFAKYPISLYAIPIQALLTFVLPFAFISYFPAVILLDKNSTWSWIGYLTPAVGLLVAGAAAVVWRRGLRRYHSSGS